MTTRPAQESPVDVQWLRDEIERLTRAGYQPGETESRPVLTQLLKALR